MKSKKLSLDKVRVAKLNYSEKIMGGKKDTFTSIKCDTIGDCNISTKTKPIDPTNSFM